jgi:AmiR/NasT family two-component response regulator
MTNRAVIDQAIGIMMSRQGVSPGEAFTQLSTISQREHVKVAEIAAGVVQAAVRRARGRRPDRA